MRTYVSPLLGLIAAALIAPNASARGLQPVDAARVLAAGGNTIGGPGLFSFQKNQGVNVMDLSSVPDDVCASILVVSGTAEINLKDPADVMLESSTANATQNGGCCRLRQQCRSRRGQVQLQLHGGLQGRLAGRQEVAAESNKPGLSQAGSLAGMAKQPAGMREVC